MSSKSMLARLLAKENIEVVEGNFRTASFDVVNRVLNIPLWKDMGASVHDLLIGHEVGHALFTPADGWHDAATDVEGIPRAFLNIIEDIRIERAVQARYPGLVRSFKEGYNVLFKENFFGTKDRDLTSYGLPDRINIKAKLNDLVDIKFSDEEAPIVAKCFSVVTWGDVVEAARELCEFYKASVDQPDQPDQEVPNFPQASYLGEQSIGGEEDDETREDGDREGTEKGDSADQPSDIDPDAEDESDEDVSDGKGSSDQPAKEVEEEPAEDNQSVSTKSAGGASENDVTVETDDAFRSNESKLVETKDDGSIPVNATEITASDVEKVVIGYKEVFASRDECAKEYGHYNPRYPGETVYGDPERQAELKKFVADTDKVVSTMAKEFEIKKAAFRYSRAKTARSGTLDMAKVHSYKYNDDIFARNLVMADAKNHGMIMYVDYSGSMADTISSVLRQIINLAMFCRKVNIPFEVYGFTSNYSNEYRATPITRENIKTNIDLSDVSIFELINNRMSRAEYDRAVRDLYFQSMALTTRWGNWYEVASRFEQLGGTPLDTTVLCAFKLADKFKSRYNVDKLNTVFLTDGSSNEVNVRDRYIGYRDTYYYLTVNGRRLKIDKKYHDNFGVTEQLINAYRKYTSGSVINYFLVSRNHEARWMIQRNVDSFEKIEEEVRFFRKNKFSVMDEAMGYDRMFVIKGGKELDPTDEEFDVLAGAKKGELTRQFKKFTGSKKGNRVLVTKFTEMVA